MTATAQFASGDQAVWTGTEGLFEHPVTIVKVRVAYLLIFGQAPEDGEIVYDIHDPVIDTTVFGIPASQLKAV